MPDSSCNHITLLERHLVWVFRMLSETDQNIIMSLAEQMSKQEGDGPLPTQQPITN